MSEHTCTQAAARRLRPALGPLRVSCMHACARFPNGIQVQQPAFAKASNPAAEQASAGAPKCTQPTPSATLAHLLRAAHVPTLVQLLEQSGQRPTVKVVQRLAHSLDGAGLGWQPAHHLRRGEGDRLQQG